MQKLLNLPLKQKIDSQMCYDAGIANKVVEDDKLLVEAKLWANTIARRSPQALSNTKKLMRESLRKSYFDTFKQEAEIQMKSLDLQSIERLLKHSLRKGRLSSIK